MLRACVISNDSEKLEKCLTAYSAQTKRFVVVDTEKTHEENEATIARLKLDALHATETSLSSSSYASLFSGGYGGFRNICLLLCAKDGSDAAFFDDDTLPANDCVARYETLFSEGKKIVCGKYLKHASGTAHLVLQVISVLRERQKGADAEDCKRRLSLLFAGVPKEINEVLTSTRASGGNLGVSLDSLRRYCFLPSPYRLEDGLFGSLATRYLGEGAVYSPLDKTEAAARLPLVFHEKTPVKNALVNNLRNEIKGAALAYCVVAKLDGKPVDVQTAASVAYEEYLLPYLAQKNEQHSLSKTAAELGFADEFNAIISIKPEKITPSEDEAVSLASSFVAARRAWHSALEWASRS
ncbi:Uncharacterised protein [Candidatus Norongarragalina meridionalis]|nr:Uncharacterised protein [Candidatus Norongarragalina meridionalis]